MWQYRTLTFLLIPFAFIYSVWYTIKHRDFCYLLNRFAINLPALSNQCIWVHAASVGEVNASRSLIEELKKIFPDHEILISTNTVTGKKTVLQTYSNTIRHIYLPFDINPVIKHALRKYHPECFFIIETEIWPNLYTACKQFSIPLIMINARLSEQTLSTYTWLQNAYAKALQASTLILARSNTDAERYIKLGAHKNNVTALGNIKYSVQSHIESTSLNISQAYILAASTREQEEKIIVKAWQQATTQLMLVIALRHPHRLKDVLDDLTKFSLNIAVRSRQDVVTDSTDIYIVDTLGELDSFIQQSEFVIMCGSFVEKGGHNLIEAANAGKAIIFGKSMFNFHDEANDFLQHDAAIQAVDADALSATITELSQNTAQRSELANNASKRVQAYKNILGNYVAAIKEAINA